MMIILRYYLRATIDAFISLMLLSATSKFRDSFSFHFIFARCDASLEIIFLRATICLFQDIRFRYEAIDYDAARVSRYYRG